MYTDRTCSGPAEVAAGKSCEGRIVRWTFNTTTNQCAQVIYGGCGATSNNFASQSDCQSTCGDVSFCSLDQDPGHCYATQKQWFYSKNKGECQEFVYGEPFFDYI
jgi:hypothetical protein